MTLTATGVTDPTNITVTGGAADGEPYHLRVIFGADGSPATYSTVHMAGAPPAEVVTPIAFPGGLPNINTQWDQNLAVIGNSS